MLARVKIQEQDLSPTLHLRYRSCANSLSRACRYAQNALDRRLACDSPGARKPTPQPAADPPADISEAEAAEMLRRTQAAIDACRNRLANAQPPTRPDGTLNFPPDRSQRRSASALMQALSAGGPPKAAVGSATAAAAFGP
ncbi:hypothetical protein [Rhodopila globiformis]|uniref:Uncharacterized protein n=1 Tax=Rhodopila globiformis TaxID=1071 RepID=A0A2S6NLW7_RHOGL|nr:hypothetical protein [Rhodopila globiformis]PPQ36632.1 hypothetical protein CCS01_04525 [Rhodopila globiformis]